ncbi:MAG: trehalose-6-phosphate synthase [Sorangiineae bacterium PRO1]|nr:trehalose-6-phosphate synthase [Sorangiineae bacterium PRO1]
MSKTSRLAVALVIGLGLLTWAAWALVHRTTQGWFEKDVRLRADLAVGGARRSLVAHWTNPSELGDVLADITRDERIMAAAACSDAYETLARTRDYPAVFSCRQVGDDLANSRGGTHNLPGGEVHVSALPLDLDGRRLGFVVLVHDLSFLNRREATMQRFLIGAFALLAMSASALTFLATRWAFRRWSNELRSELESQAPTRPEFRPLIGDVRALVERVVSERDAELDTGEWNPQRLKQTLQRHLHGERIIVVANREPYIHERAADGSTRVVNPASGLVTALEPVMRACSGVWVAHGSGSADRETVDAHDRVQVPPGEESYAIRRVWLGEAEEHGYYYGFANEGLWPLCHIAHTRPVFRAGDFEQYSAATRKFVEAVASEVDSDDPIILVQDYHLALAPKLIRERLPKATVLTFWHVPWPNAERFGICPWRKELLEGLLGSSIVGFHTQAHCNNFFDSVDRYLEARIDRELSAVVRGGHRTFVRPYPISVEWPVHWLADLPPAAQCRQNVRERLGLKENALIGVGVDRLDYTKGVEERLLAVERLLELHPEHRGRFTFIQVAAPSRTLIERYRQLNDAVVALAERINQRFGADGYRPVILLHEHHQPPQVFELYRAADVVYVSSLHDGMNLVAKEFVAAREDEGGVLVLSQFTGAAQEMPEALLVNPYDIEQAATALGAALHMSTEEQRQRMRALRRHIAEFNVYRWAGRMLVDAARLRRRQRVRLAFDSTTDEAA